MYSMRPRHKQTLLHMWWDGIVGAEVRLPALVWFQSSLLRFFLFFLNPLYLGWVLFIVFPRGCGYKMQKNPSYANKCLKPLA